MMSALIQPLSSITDNKPDIAQISPRMGVKTKAKFTNVKVLVLPSFQMPPVRFNDERCDDHDQVFQNTITGISKNINN